MLQEIQPAIETLLENQFYKALIFILLSIIFAKISDIFFSSILRRIALKTKTDIDEDIIDVFHSPIYYSILFIGIGLSVSNLGFTDFIDFIVIGALKTLIVVIWSSAIYKFFFIIIKWYSEKTEENDTYQVSLLPLFSNLSKIIIFLGAVYFLFLSWGINVTGWLASAGILAMVLGLAAKDTLANLFAGVFIMADTPYKEGDYINLDSGERGYVIDIGLRSTRIMTRDDIEITIPNSVIANSKIVNESGGPYEKERVRVNVSVAYGSDINQVRKILVEIAHAEAEVSESPPPRVRLRNFGESSLDFQLLFWIDKPEFRGRVVDRILENIYNQFNNENIEIPFPQRTIHINNNSNES